jgi:hypothetical protein
MDRCEQCGAEFSRWKPIETAPKMKTIILFANTLFDEDGRVLNWKMATGCWHSGYENDDKHTPWTWGGHQLAKYDIQPTHWQSLPEAPE